MTTAPSALLPIAITHAMDDFTPGLANATTNTRISHEEGHTQPQLSLGSRWKMAALNEVAAERARCEAACAALLLKRFPSLANCSRTQIRQLLKTTKMKTFSSRPPLPTEKKSNVICREGDVLTEPVLMLIASGSVDVYMRSPFMDVRREKHPQILLTRLGAGDELNAYAVCGKPVDQAEMEHMKKTITYEPSPYTLVVSPNSEHKSDADFEMKHHRGRKMTSGQTYQQNASPFQKLVVYTVSLQVFRNVLCSQPMLYETIQQDILGHLEWRRELRERKAYAHTQIGGYSADRTPFTLQASSTVSKEDAAFVPTIPTTIASSTKTQTSPVRTPTPLGKALDLRPKLVLHKFTHREIQSQPAVTLPPHSAIARILNAPSNSSLNKPPSAYAFSALMQRTVTPIISDDDPNSQRDARSEEKQQPSTISQHQTRKHPSSASTTSLINPSLNDGPIDPMTVDSDSEDYENDPSVTPAVPFRKVERTEAKRYISPEEAQLRKYIEKQRLIQAAQESQRRAKEAEQYERDIAVVIQKALAIGLNNLPAPSLSHKGSPIHSRQNSPRGGGGVRPSPRSKEPSPAASSPVHTSLMTTTNGGTGRLSSPIVSRSQTPAASRSNSPRTPSNPNLIVPVVLQSTPSQRHSAVNAAAIAGSISTLARLLQANDSAMMANRLSVSPPISRKGSRAGSRVSSPRPELVDHKSKPNSPRRTSPTTTAITPDQPNTLSPAGWTGGRGSLPLLSSLQPISVSSRHSLPVLPVHSVQHEPTASNLEWPTKPESSEQTIDTAAGSSSSPTIHPSSPTRFSSVEQITLAPLLKAANEYDQSSDERSNGNRFTGSIHVIPPVTAPLTSLDTHTHSSSSDSSSEDEYQSKTLADFEREATALLARAQARLVARERAERKKAAREAKQRIEELRRSASGGLTDVAIDQAIKTSTHISPTSATAVVDSRLNRKKPKEAIPMTPVPESRGLLQGGLMTRRFSRSMNQEMFSPAIRAAMMASQTNPGILSVAQLHEQQANEALAFQKEKKHRRQVSEEIAKEFGLLDSPTSQSTMSSTSATKQFHERKQSSFLNHGFQSGIITRPDGIPSTAAPVTKSSGLEKVTENAAAAPSTTDLETLFRLGSSGAKSATSTGHERTRKQSVFKAAPSDSKSDAAALAAFSQNLSPMQAVAALRRATTLGETSQIPIFTTPTRNSNGSIIVNTDPTKPSYAEFFGGALNAPSDQHIAAAQALNSGIRPDLINSEMAHRRRGEERARQVSAILTPTGLIKENGVQPNDLIVGSSHAAGGRNSVSASQREIDSHPLNLLGFLSTAQIDTVGMLSSSTHTTVPGHRTRLSFSFGHVIPSALVPLTEEVGSLFEEESSTQSMRKQLESMAAYSPLTTKSSFSKPSLELASPTSTTPAPNQLSPSLTATMSSNSLVTQSRRRSMHRSSASQVSRSSISGGARSLSPLTESQTTIVEEEDGSIEPSVDSDSKHTILHASSSAPNIHSTTTTNDGATELHHSQSAFNVLSSTPSPSKSLIPKSLTLNEGTQASLIPSSTTKISAAHRQTGTYAPGSRLTLNTLHPWSESEWLSLRERVTSVIKESQARANITLSDIFHFQGLENDPAAIMNGLGLSHTTGLRAGHFLDHRTILSGLASTPTMNKPGEMASTIPNTKTKGIYALSIILASFSNEHPVYGVGIPKFTLKKEMSGDVIKDRKVKARKLEQQKLQRRLRQEERLRLKEQQQRLLAQEEKLNQEEGEDVVDIETVLPPPSHLSLTISRDNSKMEPTIEVISRRGSHSSVDRPASLSVRSPESGGSSPLNRKVSFRGGFVRETSGTNHPSPSRWSRRSTLDRHTGSPKRTSAASVGISTNHLSLVSTASTPASAIHSSLLPTTPGSTGSMIADHSPTMDEISHALTFLSVTDPKLIEEALQQFNFMGLEQEETEVPCSSSEQEVNAKQSEQAVEQSSEDQPSNQPEQAPLDQTTDEPNSVASATVSDLLQELKPWSSSMNEPTQESDAIQQIRDEELLNETFENPESDDRKSDVHSHDLLASDREGSYSMSPRSSRDSSPIPSPEPSDDGQPLAKWIPSSSSDQSNDDDDGHTDGNEAHPFVKHLSLDPLVMRAIGVPLPPTPRTNQLSSRTTNSIPSRDDVLTLVDGSAVEGESHRSQPSTIESCSHRSDKVAEVTEADTSTIPINELPHQEPILPTTLNQLESNPQQSAPHSKEQANEESPIVKNSSTIEPHPSTTSQLIQPPPSDRPQPVYVPSSFISTPFPIPKRKPTTPKPIDKFIAAAQSVLMIEESKEESTGPDPSSPTGHQIKSTILDELLAEPIKPVSSVPSAVPVITAPQPLASAKSWLLCDPPEEVSRGAATLHDIRDIRVRGHSRLKSLKQDEILSPTRAEIQRVSSLMSSPTISHIQSDGSQVSVRSNSTIGRKQLRAAANQPASTSFLSPTASNPSFSHRSNATSFSGRPGSSSSSIDTRMSVVDIIHSNAPISTTSPLIAPPPWSWSSTTASTLNSPTKSHRSKKSIDAPKILTPIAQTSSVPSVIMKQSQSTVNLNSNRKSMAEPTPNKQSGLRGSQSMKQLPSSSVNIRSASNNLGRVTVDANGLPFLQWAQQTN